MVEFNIIMNPMVSNLDCLKFWLHFAGYWVSIDANMQSTRSQYRWRECRRKVQKFLGMADVSAQGTVSCDASDRIESFAADESYELTNETSFMIIHPDLPAETSTSASSPVDGNAMRDCEMTEGCWNYVDVAEIQTSDSDSDNGDVSSAQNTKQILSQWACTHNVTHAALTDLLKGLKLLGLDVPVSAASLLKTPRSVMVQQKSGGDYVYLGLAKSLSKHLSKITSDSLLAKKEIELHVNIDGLPLFKSSPLSVWPVLCSISCSVQLRSKPFPVAMFCGLKKPSNFEFLSDFIAESKTLSSEGFHYNGSQVFVKIVGIICDAPAKAFVKGIVQFNGTYGCDRCVQKGEYSEGRMLFLRSDAALRTNDSFRRQENGEHHKQPSPFCDLPLDMINDFPIDYLHLVNLGVTKRLLLAWICGPLKSRLSSSQIKAISMNLIRLRSYMPKELSLMR